jgi:hypothetical protein
VRSRQRPVSTIAITNANTETRNLGIACDDDEPTLGNVVVLGSTTVVVVGFVTSSGRSQGDCNTCFADAESCSTAFYCPNLIAGIGPTASNGPFGIETPHAAGCVDDCDVCADLTHDPVASTDENECNNGVPNTRKKNKSSSTAKKGRRSSSVGSL